MNLALDRSPVTVVILLAWLAAAAWTGLLSPSTASLADHGAAVGIFLPEEPWRLLSNTFLHGGLLHLLMNAMSLTMVAPMIEATLGGTRFALLYVVTGIAGAAAGVLSNHGFGVLIGGSGAVFGMFGAMVALLSRSGRGRLDFLRYHGPRSIVALIVANLAIGFMIPHISNGAHIGGLVAGFVMVWCFFDPARDRHRVHALAVRLGWIAALAVLLWFAVRPVLSIEWSMREALLHPDARTRSRHEARLEALGYDLDSELAAMRDLMPKLLGESGRRFLRRIQR